MPRIVYSGTAEWWDIVSGKGDITLGDSWRYESELAARAAGIDLSDLESWAARVESVSQDYSSIRIGDYACSQGIGEDVIFVRLHPEGCSCGSPECTENTP